MGSFTPIAEGTARALDSARVLAGSSGADAITSRHLLAAIVRDAMQQRPLYVLLGSETMVHRLQATLESATPASPPRPSSAENDIPWTYEAKTVLSEAVAAITRMSHSHCTPGHILIAMLTPQRPWYFLGPRRLSSGGQVLAALGVQVEKLEANLALLWEKEELGRPPGGTA
jgi:ATP-dependent Clp protease ATP-binding subunit ClpA